MDNTTPIRMITISDTLETASDKMAAMIQQYPDYVRAWKTMHSNYGKDNICFEWRGTIGLMRFIEDTATLDNNPTILSSYDIPVKLKRKQPAFMFSPLNVYWYIPRTHAHKIASLEGITGTDTTRMHAPTTLPSILTTITGVSIESIKQSYPTIQEKEARLEELFTLSMTQHLTPIEQAELDILGKLVVRDDIPTVPASLPKCEDI